MESRQATWLELFFDLVFVAVIGVLTHKVAHLHDGHLDYRGVVEVLLIFAPIWWIWASFTLYANRYEQDDRKHRLVHLIVMGIIISMSATFKTIETNGFKYFAVLYALTRVTLAFLYLKFEENSKYNKKIASSLFVGGSIVLISALIPSPLRYFIFFVGPILEITFHVRQSNQVISCKVHRKHLAERIGLLTIILLGESIISIVSTLGDVNWTFSTIYAGLTGFVILGLIWWIFYDSFHVFDHAKKFKNENYLIYPNFFLSLGLISLATLIRHSISGEMGLKDFQLLVLIGMTMFYIGKQIPYMYLFASMRKGIVINTITCIVITYFCGFFFKVHYATSAVMIAMLFYVFSNMKWVIPKDFSEYLDKE